MLSQTFIDEMKQAMLEAKKKLEDDLAGLSAHTEMGDSEEDNAEEVEVDEVNRNLIVRIREDLAKINKALMKIENGSYGLDDEGRAIAEDRLRAMPWADKAL